jgi:activator-of-BECN1-regulated-autophagy protein 1
MTKSTISIAFSPDGNTFASTHGDHTVKIVQFSTGKILQVRFNYL